jgi:hypothetical protein
VAILVLGSAYYIRTRHLPLSRRGEDRRARLYVLLMGGVGVLGLSVILAFDVAMLLQR